MGVLMGEYLSIAKQLKEGLYAFGYLRLHIPQGLA